MDSLTQTAFWFLRHGETDWNQQGLSQGQVEVPLNQSGLAQAERAAAHLAAPDLPGGPIRAIVASPLGRAQQTAQIVGRVLGLSHSNDADLRETSFGDQEGKPIGHWYEEWVEHRFTPAGGETFTALQARVVPAVNRALALPGPVLIIAHGAMFRGVRAAMGLSPRIRTENGIPIHCRPGPPWTLVPLS
jgi:probable phosphoglycerate mutase